MRKRKEVMTELLNVYRKKEDTTDTKLLSEMAGRIKTLEWVLEGGKKK